MNLFQFIKNFLFICNFGRLSKIVFRGSLLNTNIIIIYKGKCLDKMYLFDKYCWFSFAFACNKSKISHQIHFSQTFVYRVRFNIHFQLFLTKIPISPIKSPISYILIFFISREFWKQDHDQDEKLSCLGSISRKWST